MAFDWLQTGASAGSSRLEFWLEKQRDQLPLWLPILLGTGIVLWFVLPTEYGWIAVILAGVAVGLFGLASGLKRRIGQVLFWSGFMVAFGCGLVWWRSAIIASPRIDRPIIAQFEATVTKADRRPDGKGIRLLVHTQADPTVPPILRVTVPEDYVDGPYDVGARLEVRARLMPPPEAAIPGAYDFSRAAWFQKIGATGRALEAPRRLDVTTSDKASWRNRLSDHVRSQVPGSAGGIAAAFVTGDRAGIDEADEEAMRASGLTHLLSISGLHITAVVGAAIFLALRLLALFPALALRWPLLLISAGIGASAGIGYTLLTGAEVPTIRSCIAALLVLGGLALGREALTLRLVATGALVVLVLWPEAIVGASFQLSFAAITTIVALHELQWVKTLTKTRDEPRFKRFGRGVLELLLTGIAVEIALAPIALFHFHKSGVYGALANIVAIPLTTFVIMPAEAIALFLDSIGLGEPFWWLAEQGLDFLLWMARTIAAAPGAVAAFPSMPIAAFALILGGGIWTLIWHGRACLVGLIPFLFGLAWALTTPQQDVLITGDGRHVAIRSDNGQLGILRTRAGDYVRSILGEGAGETEGLPDLDALPGAECGPDVCVVTVRRNGRSWEIAATRTGQKLPWADLVHLCGTVDIIVSDRKLPPACAPRWIKADRKLLARTGGLAITLSTGTVQTARRPEDDHPWTQPSRLHILVAPKKASQPTLNADLVR
jgi:competence protein ComEC